MSSTHSYREYTSRDHRSTGRNDYRDPYRDDNRTADSSRRPNTSRRHSSYHSTQSSSSAQRQGKLDGVRKATLAAALLGLAASVLHIWMSKRHAEREEEEREERRRNFERAKAKRRREEERWEREQEEREREDERRRSDQTPSLVPESRLLHNGSAREPSRVRNQSRRPDVRSPPNDIYDDYDSKDNDYSGVRSTRSRSRPAEDLQ